MISNNQIKGMRIALLFVTSLFLIAFSSSTIQAQVNSGKGYELLKKVDDNLKGYEAYTSDMRMVLVKKDGKSFTRNVRTYVKSVPGDGDKVLSIFDSPADIKGTKLLAYTHLENADDQWLFLPALGRTKRIANKNQSGSFLGSELAYEDIGNSWLEKFSYKYIRDDVYEAKPCYVVHAFPRSKYSGYSYLELWVEKERELVIYQKYHNRKKELLKEEFSEYVYLEEGNGWYPSKVLLANRINGRKTEIQWTNYKFDVQLNDADFHTGALARKHQR